MSSIIPHLPKRYSHGGEKNDGGFGDVIFCKDEHLERIVAIKTIKNISQIERLRDEISALLKLRSKHVVQVFDIVEGTDSNFGIVMEFVEGDDLFHIDRENLDSNQLLKILWQIASGIADIHSAGVIHRDIKPNNMKLDNEGILKIFDFGLARNTGKNAQTVGFKGTFGFSAPEQYTNNAVSFTSAIDTYAFGATALYLATNGLPQELHDVPPRHVPPSCFDIGLLKDYPSLISVIHKCLSSSPASRPSMSHVKDELAKQLLFDKHQALAVINGQPHKINSSKRVVKLGFGNIGSFELVYNGTSFNIKNVTGEVYVNNIVVTPNMEIPSSCVVVFGSANRHYTQRSFVTFDVSNPEVAL